MKILKNQYEWLDYLLIPFSYFIVAFDISKLEKKRYLYFGLKFLPFTFYPIVAFGKSQINNKPGTKKVVKKKLKKK